MSYQRCSKCGAINNPGANFCHGCGQTFVSANKQPTGTRYCRACGQPNRVNAKHCTRCGQSIRSGELARALAPKPLVGASVCPYCNFQYRIGVKFCASCGKSLQPSKSRIPVLDAFLTKQYRSIPVWPVAAILIFACLAIFTGTTILVVKGDTPDKVVTIITSNTPSPISSEKGQTSVTITSTVTKEVLPTPTSTETSTLTFTPTNTPSIPSRTERSQGAPVPGDVAPDFSLTDAHSGEMVTLSELTGHPVMINFWATWCGFCQEEMPAMQAAYEDRQDNGLIILAIDAKESRTEVLDFASEFGLTFNLLLDSDGAIKDLYLVNGFPTSFFLRPDGVIAEKAIGTLSEDDIRYYLDLIMD